MGRCEEAVAVALCSLPNMTPVRLRALLEGRTPFEAWAAIHAGREVFAAREAETASEGRRRPRGALNLAREWAVAARAMDAEAARTHHAAAGIQVKVRGRAGYPAALAPDRQAPPVLFSSGKLEVLEGPRVAVVGTRSCTHYGREVAAELGAGLARAGVVVLSGLALGIDGSAHEGALAGFSEGGAPPVGIAACGLDVVYPPIHARLWERVGRVGSLVSEWPLGTPPDPWRFPARNRIIAGLSQVVVVVESHRAGGAMHTVEAAAERGVPVMAVPGSVRSNASVGTNALLAEGVSPARDVDDVLTALSLEAKGFGDRRCPRGRAADSRVPPSGSDETVLGAVDWMPTATSTILARTAMGLADVAAALERLERAGWVRPGEGWWERLAPRARSPVGVDNQDIARGAVDDLVGNITQHASRR